MKSGRGAACATIALAILSLCGRLGADSFSFYGESMETESAKGKERTVLAGNAHLIMENMTITADRVELYGKDNRYALCTGSVSLLDEKRGIRATTPKLDYDRTLKLSRMQGPTVIEDKENKVVLKGAFVENDENTEILTIQIGVRILKDDMVCRSEYAVYRRKENILELTGLPVVQKGDDVYRAARITINTKTNAISMDGSVSGSSSMGSSPSPSPRPSGSPAPKPSALPPGSLPSGSPAETPAPSESAQPSPSATAAPQRKP